MRIIRSETYFPIIVGVHLILWAVDLSLYEGSLALVDGESATQRVLGEIMSSWVVTVFGFNLLMVTRIRWVERVFGGLDKMYLIHRRSGVINNPRHHRLPETALIKLHSTGTLRVAPEAILKNTI